MYQFFVEQNQIHMAEKRVVILGTDVNHIKNVLRMKPGEEISVSDGVDGKEYRCGILAFEEERVLCELRFVKEENVELSSRVYLFQALPKGDKMEWIVQKAVELGVCQVIPVAAKRCIVKLDHKKAAAKVARWQGIAEAAAKQSKRAIVPEVTSVVSFEQAMEKARKMDIDEHYATKKGMKHNSDGLHDTCPTHDTHSLHFQFHWKKQEEWFPICPTS